NPLSGNVFIENCRTDNNLCNISYINNNTNVTFEIKNTVGSFTYSNTNSGKSIILSSSFNNPSSLITLQSSISEINFIMNNSSCPLVTLNNTAAQTFNVYFNNSNVNTYNLTNAIANFDVTSMPPLGNLILSGTSSYVLTSNSYGLGYTPTTSSNWTLAGYSIPNNVRSALDSLIIKPSSRFNSPAGTQTNGGYLWTNTSPVNLPFVITGVNTVLYDNNQGFYTLNNPVVYNDAISGFDSITFNVACNVSITCQIGALFVSNSETVVLKLYKQSDFTGNIITTPTFSLSFVTSLGAINFPGYSSGSIFNILCNAHFNVGDVIHVGFYTSSGAFTAEVLPLASHFSLTVI
ncbi:MAG TPA: hypothetical protein PKI46_07610, partial [Bacteroidales bacterium]|nr:hypothetical protein [Bacteroidales bacterium]